MIQFFDEYRSFGPIWQRAVANLTWAHNIILIQKIKHLPTRLWYALHAFEHGWSRDVLSLQIQSRAHERQGKVVTNFHRTLPPPQSDLAAQLLKDPYVSAYQLTRALPKKLQSALPSIAQIEAELSTATKPAKKSGGEKRA